MATKKCTKCSYEGSIDTFPKDKYKKDGRHPHCKTCRNTAYKSRKKINPKAHNQKSLESYYKNREKALDTQRNYYKNNKEKKLESSRANYRANKETYSKRNRNWRLNNREKCSFYSAKYRACKLKATPNWLNNSQVESIISIYTNCPKGFHVDHIVPLQGVNVCGLHVPWNLQHLEASKNISKSNKLIIEIKEGLND